MTIPVEKTLEEVISLVLEESKKALKYPYKFKKPIKNVAIIGAGPSGLPTARHLKEAGFNVRVFERNSVVGGIWAYSEEAPVKPKIPSSPEEADVESEVYDGPDGGVETITVEMTPEIKKLLLTKCPPSPCYRDLQGNNPSRLFALPGLTFPEGTPLFCSHKAIGKYFQDYAEKFELLPLIKFDTSVDLVYKNDDDIWEVYLSKYDVYPSGLVKISSWMETFDAVVAASGIYQNGFVPDFKDLAAWDKMWPDKAIHSNQYRRGSISACDISRSLEGFARSVTMSMRGPFESSAHIVNLVRSTIPKSTTIKPNITSFSNIQGQVDGSVLFEDGSVLDSIDHVIFCTGYTHSLRYFGVGLLKAKSTARHPYADVPESEVLVYRSHPLNVYQEVFLMSDPTFAFVGFPPYFATPTHFDTQAQAVARVWTGNALIPSVYTMSKFTQEYDLGIDPAGLYEVDRRRKEHFSTWLNHHAKMLHKDDGVELPEVENYPEYWEKEGLEALEQWVEISTNHYKNTRESIKKRCL
ncbi:hypothetical protein INT48_003749 [Thamnidium elegans]|uniref:FAD/NAD(P)-binding domain-containing protein n=1 Tax=Thamnidium elegans TaxID=101142 RepID=A0A8H7VRA7_9FUNG|nr:hypothetical protein INT48_003749 [Thamnidium elegans]